MKKKIITEAETEAAFDALDRAERESVDRALTPDQRLAARWNVELWRYWLHSIDGANL